MRLLTTLLAGLLLAGAVRAEDAPAFDAREALAKLQAMDLFPDLEKEKSDLAILVAIELERIGREEPVFLKEPSWPIHVARRAAERLGLKPRTIAEIRASLAESFGVDEEAFQQVHGIQVVAARVRIGGQWIDVTPRIAARVLPEGLVVDCDETLGASFADESQFGRNVDEADPEYWKRQGQLLASSGGAGRGETALQVTFELHSVRVSVSAKDGERLTVSEDGKASVTRIAPAARRVKAEDAVGKTGARPAARSAPVRR